MNYNETLEWLFAQLPMYQREGKAAYKANLDNTLKLDEHFGSPHKQFKTIHVVLSAYEGQGIEGTEKEWTNKEIGWANQMLDRISRI